MQKSIECLLIDDDQDDQEIFRLCLDKIGKDINCLAMDSGVDALAMLKSDVGYTPDYIFLDVNMPKLNGIECLRVLKNMERLKNTKIFMYSTTSDSLVLEESEALGADDFIIKPSRTSDLIEKLAKVFEFVSELTDYRS